jgi:hypothetical protein
MASVFAALVLQGCGAAPPVAVRPSLVTPATTERTPAPERSALAATLAPSAGGVPEQVASPVVDAEAVMVTAASGNLFVRRGPDLAYNPISVLRKGQTASATARDVLGDWLRVAPPDDPGRDGWISIMSEFTTVTGDIDTLAELEATDWPDLAFLRNCTHNQMVLDPGGLLIPPVDSFPENNVRANPGRYVVIDVDVDGYPEVMNVDINEGSAIDIVVDGTGEKKKCPAR